MKELERFVFGTQYYRAPTPTKAEWQDDIRNIKKIGLDTIQVRAQWRWNERIRGEFDWSDLDRIFDLCEKYEIKVMFKFMLETAPQWLYDMYGCERIGRDGNKILPGAHAAFFVGGWLPCFDNLHVRKEAERFIVEAVKRYKDREAFLLWNAWNEPRSSPQGECCCEYSQESYRKWLKEKYGDIETLNSYLGKAWGSWEEIMPPAMNEDYAELYMWRQWAMHSVMDCVDWVYRTIRTVDKEHPIMTHVGMCSLIQDPVDDSSDDWLNASKVDFYGSSYPVFDFFDNNVNYARSRVLGAMIIDWIRSLSPYFWINEIYPNGGDFFPDLDPNGLASWIWTAVAHGAKGLVFWQYKPERLGFEANLAGLVHLDGSDTARGLKVAEMAVVISKYHDVFRNMHVPKAEVAIVYDHRSDIISRVREMLLGKRISYKDCLLGIYSLFLANNVAIDWVSSHELERINEYKLVYLSDMEVVGEADARVFEEYVKNSGCLVTESFLGLHSDNTWRNLKVPGH